MNVKFPPVGHNTTLPDGRAVRYLGPCPITPGRHRFMEHPKTGQQIETVWRVSDDGKCRGDRAESPCDYIGGDA